MQNPGPWPGRFIWHDLVTTDLTKAQQFYGALFDWQIEPAQVPGYHMVFCGPGPIGGMCERQDVPPHWMPHVGVSNVDATAARAKEAGGTLHVPPTDIPATGRFAIVADPCGAFFSIYQGQPDTPGFDPDQPVPGRVCWNETYSSDDDKAQAFYSAVSGWQPEIKDMGPAGIYRVQKLGDKQVGGLMKHPMPGAPSMWVAYFLTFDLAAATNKAKQLGANMMMENVPIPEIGAFSMATDPTGALFALFQPASMGPC